MTDDIPNSVSCSGCGNPLPKDRSESAGRMPCPACSSTARIFHEHIRLETGAEARVHGLTAGKRGARIAGGKRQHEFKSGDSFTVKTGRWAWLEQHIDRTKRRYRKRVIDQETGEVLYDVDEPLSEHRGRGSAKGVRNS